MESEDVRREQIPPQAGERDADVPGAPVASPPPGRVVVGVDGSGASVSALRWAVAEARRRGARLSVVVAYRHDVTLMPPLGSDAWQAAHEVLERALFTVGVEHGSVETQIVDGSPAASLVAAARGADLLVLGHQPHAPLSRTLFGAVNIERHGYPQCPVVVVPPACAGGGR